MLQPFWKKVWYFLKKLNIVITYNQVIMLLDIYSIELKNYVHTEICTHIFIVTLFIIVKQFISE